MRILTTIERFSYDLEKWFRWVFIICFISQWMKRSKYGLFVFPPKKTLIWRGHPSIGQWCCSMTSKQSVDWFLESSRAWQVFSPERSLNQSKATSVCIRSTDQSYCSISVRLLFLFCSRVFISRSYENRSTGDTWLTHLSILYSRFYFGEFSHHTCLLFLDLFGLFLKVI